MKEEPNNVHKNTKFNKKNDKMCNKFRNENNQWSFNNNWVENCKNKEDVGTQFFVLCALPLLPAKVENVIKSAWYLFGSWYLWIFGQFTCPYLLGIPMTQNLDFIPFIIKYYTQEDGQIICWYNILNFYKRWQLLNICRSQILILGFDQTTMTLTRYHFNIHKL